MGKRPKANVGHPKNESSVIAIPVGVRCSKCLTIISKGIRHDCSQKTLLSNIETISDKNPRTSDLFVSGQIKKKVEQNQSDTISFSTKGLPCTITSQSQSSKRYVSRALFPEEKLIPLSEISKIQVALDLSNNKTSKLCGMMKNLKGRRSIDPYIQKSLSERDRKLEDFFECRKLLIEVQDIKTKVVTKVERHAVICNDVRIRFVGGKGSLKITFNILEREKDDLKSPHKKASRHS